MLLEKIPESLLRLKTPPKALYFKGNLALLDNFKVAIVGTRRPNPYTKQILSILAHRISQYATIVSGGAIGVDSIAHNASLPNTIMISPSSLDIIYPKINASLIQNIAQNALILSEYESDYTPQKYSFLQRNRLVIALSDIVILPQGDLGSGTEYSSKVAISLGKPIWTLPQRYGESTLTNALLEQGRAKAIYNIDNFINENLPISNPIRVESSNKKDEKDEILDFCRIPVSYEEACARFGNKLLEYEFLGLLVRENHTIRAK